MKWKRSQLLFLFLFLFLLCLTIFKIKEVKEGVTMGIVSQGNNNRINAGGGGYPYYATNKFPNWTYGNNDGVQDCIQNCINDGNCNVLVYNIKTNQCWHKSRVSQFGANADYVSFIKIN